jgi:hypothetical protein
VQWLKLKPIRNPSVVMKILHPDRDPIRVGVFSV